MLPRSQERSYSRYSLEASRVLGAQIRAKRIERAMTAQELAERAGISRGTLRRVERGDMKCEIGVVFELAAIVGVPLHGSTDYAQLVQHGRRADERLALLPASVRISREVHDDF